MIPRRSEILPDDIIMTSFSLFLHKILYSFEKTTRSYLSMPNFKSISFKMAVLPHVCAIQKTTCGIGDVKGIPLWDFYPSDFQRALKMIIIAELFPVMTISQGWLRHNNSDNADKCSFTIVRP